MFYGLWGSPMAERDFFDEQLAAFKWRNEERARPDYEIRYDSVLGAPINEARQRYLDTMAEHQRRRAGIDDN
jgi:hypothetical protein